MSVLVLALLLLGFALLAAERWLPTHGMLGTLGLAALIAGIASAVTGSVGSLALALALTVLIAGAVGAVGAAGLVAWRQALSASRRRARCGAEGLVGHVGVVRRPLDPVGNVAIDGELWRARRSWAEADEAPPAEGEPVVVDHVRGLTLSVRRAEIWEVEE